MTSTPITTDPRIYASLHELIALRGQTGGFSFLPKQPLTSLLSGRKRSRLRGRGLDFEELRHYRLGDDIRNIDWRVSNRTGKPHVRVYNEERDRPVVVVVDQRLSMFFASKEKMKSVVACELAALSFWNVLKNGDRAGAVIFNDSEVKDFRPSRTASKATAVLSELTRMNHALSVDSQHAENPGQLQKALEQVERLVGHDYLVILISDFSGWNEQVLKSIKRIRQHNDLIAGLVFDPLEEEFSTSTHLVVSDGNYQMEVPASDAKFRKSYTENFQLSLAAIRSLLQQHDIPLLSIDNVQPCLTQVRRLLGRP